MYGKLFDSMYDGTLAEDWRALVTFQQMIILCDADGVVDMTPSAISRRTGIPIEHIKAGIEILENPDPYSKTPDEEGRRIMLIDDSRPWGWIIVNHRKYKDLQDADTVRAQTRERVRQHRERQKQAVTDCNGGNVTVTEGNGSKRHTDTDTDKKTIGQKFDLFWSTYPRKVKKQDSLKVFKRKKLHTTVDLIIRDIERRLKSDPDWMKEDGKFIPHPTTYLNGERWKDDDAGTAQLSPFHLAKQKAKALGLEDFRGMPHENQEQFIERINQSTAE